MVSKGESMSIDAMSVTLREIFSRVGAGQGSDGLHLALLEGDLIRLPRHVSSMTVLSGTAWVTYKGEDFVLGRGQSLSVGPRLCGAALVSPLGDSALFLELD
jgi:hypothetical protein